MLKNFIIVGVGGFFGSVCRYLTHIYVEKHISSTFPYGTFIANMAGCLLIGMVFSLSEKGNLLTPEWRLFLTVGFCGGFTTFSSFAYNNLTMLKENSISYFLWNTGLSVFIGILAVYAGIVLVRFILN